MKNFYQRRLTKGIIFSASMIGAMVFLVCLVIYAGIGYYPFDLLPDSLIRSINYFILICSMIIIPIQLIFFFPILIKVKKAMREDKATNNSFKELKSLLTGKFANIGLFFIIFFALLYLLIVYWIFTTDFIALVIGRATIGALVGIIMILIPVAFFFSNDEHYKTIELVCTNYLLDKQEIIELAGGQGNVETKAESITYFSTKKHNPKDADATMIVYNKNDKANTQLTVNLKLSIGANENAWQVTEMNYTKHT